MTFTPTKTATGTQRSGRASSKAVIILAVVMLSGCAASTPMRYYSVQSVAAVDLARPVAYQGAPLEVGSVQVPPTMDRLEMVRTVSPIQLEILDMAHWAAPLGTLSRQALTEDLASRLPKGRLIFPGTPTPQIRALLTVNVMSFSVANGAGTMLVSWSVHPPMASGPSPAADSVPPQSRGQSLRLETPASDSPDATARAWSQLLAQLSDRIAAELVASS
jgi:uncharacterized protein